MKKIKKGLAVLIVVLVLVACGKVETTVCEGLIDPTLNVVGTVEFTGKNNLLTTYKTTQKVSFATIGMDNEEEIKAVLAEGATQAGLTDNVAHTVEFEDESVILSIVIKNVKKASTEEFAYAGLEVSAGNKISVSKSVENQETYTDMVCTTK